LILKESKKEMTMNSKKIKEKNKNMIGLLVDKLNFVSGKKKKWI
jgi:hypothetical protein